MLAHELEFSDLKAKFVIQQAPFALNRRVLCYIQHALSFRVFFTP